MNSHNISYNLLRYALIIHIIIIYVAFSAYSQDTIVADSVREHTLQEIVIKPKKEKYSKKNNPAVELIQAVRENKNNCDPRKERYYSFDSYDKMVISLNDYKGYIEAEKTGKNKKNGELSRRQKILVSLIDTAIWTGKRTLDLSIKEKTSTSLYANNGSTYKKIVTGLKSSGIDKSFDEGMTRVYFEDALREINIFSDEIAVLRTNFVSPLAAIGADYYMYFLEDTVQIGKDICCEISFAPKNPESLGFNGKLYIPVNDSVKYIKRAMLRLPKAANVNYVDNLILSQTFRKDSLGNVHKILDDMVVELRIIKGTPSVYLCRQSRYGSFKYNKRSDYSRYLTKVGTDFQMPDAYDKDSFYWTFSRMIPLSRAEHYLQLSDSPFRNIPFFKWSEKILKIVIDDYVPTGKNSKFDLGPIDSFVSYRGSDGWRFAVGGMTTGNLSPHFFAKGYVAYGLRNETWKYNAELEYSFNKKRYYASEFPINSIKVGYTYDTNTLGEKYLSKSATNLLSSFKRLYSKLSTYQRLARVEYQKEWNNHLSFKATVQHDKEIGSSDVAFVNGYGETFDHYDMSSLKLQLRYATDEKFIITSNSRSYVNREGFTCLISHEFGPKNFLGNAYTINLTEVMAQKRLWFSAFGYMDILVKGGKLWNQVQFPALLWQNANTAYTMRSESFAMLNPMEFAMDEYASLDFTYNMMGALLNRIPLIKKAKLREVFTFKGFVGHLTKKNNPDYNPNLYRFPDAATVPMGNTPYMEIGVGLDNILTFLRVDYVWRLTYRNKPGAPNSGLRFSLHFSF